MMFIPLPFVVSLFLLIFLIQMIRRSEGSFRENRLFLLLIAAYTLQSILIGFRWGYGIRAVLPFQAILATTIAALAWVSFSSLTRDRSVIRRHDIWPHVLPPGLVCLLLLFWPAPIDPVLITIFLAYGAALLWLARLGPDGLVASRLDGVVRSYRSLLITAFAMIGSAVTDVIISLDFVWEGGVHSGAVIAIANVLALFILGGAAAIAGSGTAADEPAETASEDTNHTNAVLEPEATQAAPVPEAALATEEDRSIAAALDALMQTKQLYKDIELNLGRLARRLGLPARSVSAAINRIHGMSVSQYVNNYRIKEACHLLASTEAPVTTILFESGFQTKSNFNREFLRVTGLSPTAWRQQQIPVNQT